MTYAHAVEHLQGGASLISHCDKDAVFFFSPQGKVWELWAEVDSTYSWCCSTRHCGWLALQNLCGILLAFCEPDDHCRLLLQGQVKMVPHINMFGRLPHSPNNHPMLPTCSASLRPAQFDFKSCCAGVMRLGCRLLLTLFLVAPAASS